LGIIAGSALIHGWWTQRWSASRELEEATERLSRVAMNVGDWKGQEEGIDADEINQAGLTGCWRRRYTHRRNGSAVTALLMVGPPGQVAVHTPDWCYAGAGYVMATPAERQTLENVGDLPAAEFWTAQFTKEHATIPTNLRIYWSWNANGPWKAPEFPRLSFGRYQALYKLYLIRNLDNPEESVQEDRCLGLLRQLLPELDRALFRSSD
jgi:hypothetical protein